MLRLGARPLPGLARPGPTSIILHPSARTYATKGPSRSVRSATRQQGKLGNESMPAPTMQQLRQTMTFVPGAFVRLPLSEVPKQPAAFLTYQWYSFRNYITEVATSVGLRWKSKPSFFEKARLPIKRSATVAAASGLHATLGMAFALGDRGVLRRAAMPALFDSLSNTIAARDPAETLDWTRLEVHSARVASHRAMVMPAPFPPNVIVEQAVVALDTTQQLKRVDRRWNTVIPGSTKVQRRTEYLGIHRVLDATTFEAEEWAVIGNTTPTTLEEWEEWRKYEKNSRDQAADKKIQQAREGTL